MCKTARMFSATVSGMSGEGSSVSPDEFLQTRRVVERADGTRVEGEWCVILPLPSLSDACPGSHLLIFLPGL